MLGRDAGTAVLLVEIVEESGAPLEGGIHPALDGSQGMIGGHGGVKVEDGEEFRLRLRLAAHALSDAAQPIGFNSTGDLPNSPLSGC